MNIGGIFIEGTLYQKTKAIIERYDFLFKKNFGQNFLIDERVLEKIINAGNISEDDVVLEIGPGIGTLTQAIARKAKTVIAVEIDRTLIPILEETLSNFDNIRLINEDILRVDIRALSEEYGRPLKVIANLPYYITTPIIMNILEREYPVSEIVVMIQKEVAMRMQAQPGTKDYGSLSVVTGYYAKAYLAANVPKNCFMPRPNVDSAVIRLAPYDRKPFEAENSEKFFKFIKAAFSQRRKTLVNCMASSPDFKYTKEEFSALLKAKGYDERIRGEALALSDFAAIYEAMD
ncbi:MAG: 16S rRNA (adenine(1518)-N(6)/adenine(1519)-N(6))-dimethyltransferase RsmA [Clostridiales bacterium]|nr:16S rRNA (adenine(1518)-N(6)/adenine(1519)-N(6))-dimethyltransferase RsmA [Clostridiales bacterium]